MAVKRYRYKSAGVDMSTLPEEVPGTPTIVAGSPYSIFIDITIEEEFKGDLDDYMVTNKWTFEVEVALADPSPPLQMFSPNGSPWDVGVDDAGNLVITPG